jgi:hypothetical protein
MRKVQYNILVSRVFFFGRNFWGEGIYLKRPSERDSAIVFAMDGFSATISTVILGLGARAAGWGLAF